MLSKIRRTALRIGKRVLKYEEQVEELNRLRQENNDLKKMSGFSGWPAGHFYSPIHSLEDLECFEEVVKRSQGKFTKSIPGFSDKKMVEEFNKIKKYFSEFDYPKDYDGKGRFYTKNTAISMMDALTLFSMIKLKKPKRIIEIGSGFSSALMMDVNERFFENKIEMTFIEPFPEVLNQRMSEEDKKRYKIIAKGVQFVPVEIFKTLEKDDILFIDSTHVSKFNSDVNYELFDILPELNSGVIIHFHDILDGFEYPIYWLNQGWAWNEAYLLRAYLMGNENYDVLLMTNYLTNRHPELLKESYPKENILNGGDLWLKKI